ncbi:hypothetical protein [Devosia ginsengisoli]|uniref:Right handed beta helix domain-containing protein n=1 Tax=Devosia ginsengisoli TaxID=400770 RepID=A0A5B8LUD6_9HYPH|nr:hypothetical protein [Devosia ginsengisoli]QDZ11646.1 hypothetical protein FPZ08_13290 [Devosia ginsengisoli]
MDSFQKFCLTMAAVFVVTGGYMTFSPGTPGTPTATQAREVPASGNISEPGQYTLRSNRNNGHGSNTIISITASGVELDLDGNILQCAPPASPDTVTTGINIAGNDVIVRNGQLLGCFQAISIAGSMVTLEDLIIHARYMGVTATDDVANLTVKSSEFHDIAGATELVYAVGINRPGNDCLIEGNFFRNIHRQLGARSDADGEGVAVIFTAGSSGCVARENRHENTEINHLEIGYWVGNAQVTIQGNTLINIGRGVAVSKGTDAYVVGNSFTMRQPTAESYAIGATQGLAADNTIVGYETPLLEGIAGGGNVITP